MAAPTAIPPTIPVFSAALEELAVLSVLPSAGALDSVKRIVMNSGLFIERYSLLLCNLLISFHPLLIEYPVPDQVGALGCFAIAVPVAIPRYERLLNTLFITATGIEKGYVLIKYGRIVAIARD